MRNKLKNHLLKQGFRFSFDLDDTIWETSAIVLDYVNDTEPYKTILKEKGFKKLEKEDIKSFFFYEKLFGKELTKEIFSFEGLYSKELPIIKGIDKLIHFLKKEIGEEHIQIVTANYQPKKNKLPKNKLVKEILGLPSKNIHHTSQKTSKIKGTIHFEDGIHNFNELIDCNKTLKVCVLTPWNKELKEILEKMDLKINNYEEIYEVLKDLFENDNEIKKALSNYKKKEKLKSRIPTN